MWASNMSTEPKFACPSCGKQYKWKPEMAGRSAKCPCGAKLVVPATAPAAPAPPAKTATSAIPLSVEEPVKAELKCPSCGQSLSPEAVLCINCGYNLKTGQMLSVVVETSDAGADDTGAPIGDAKPAKKSGA
jgi:DNA-directed RNA polymerase subunit RPC12/RpoP